MPSVFPTFRALALGAPFVIAIGCVGADSIGPADSGALAVTITPKLDSLDVGQSRAFTARVVDEKNVSVDRLLRWSSTNPASATVDDAGVVTALAVGTTRIVAATATVADTATVIVRTSNVPFQVLPSAATVALGQALQLTISVFGNGAFASDAVVWSTSDSSIATVSADGVVSTLGIGAVSLTAVVAGASSSATIKVTKNSVVAVSVTPANSTLFPAQSEELTATLLDQSGRPINGRVVKWSSSNPDVAAVSSKGTVTGLAKGTSIITASSEGKSSSATLNVLDVPVASVSVALGASSIPVGQTTVATATLKDDSGRVLTGRTVAWQSSNPALATVNAAGLITGIALGNVTISAISEGKIGSAALAVTSPAPINVLVSPSTIQLSPGGTQQVSASLVDAAGAPMTSLPVTWSSSNTAVAVVSPTGLVTAVSSGTAAISATAGGVTGVAAVSVATPPAPVAAVTVTLANTTILAGQSTQATAVVRDGAGNVVSGRTVTWSTTDAALATVSPNGLVTALAAGSATIVAKVEQVTGAQTLVINPPPVAVVSSVSITAPVTTLTVGGATTLSVTLRDASGQTIPLSGRTVGWWSSNPGIVTVSPSGVATAVSAGSVVISASVDGTTGTLPLSVNAPTQPPPPTVASVTVSITASALTVGQTAQATATPRDASGNVLTGRVVTWSSSNATVASVAASGLVTAVAAGSATISAAVDGKTGSVPITVAAPPPPPPPPTGIAVYPGQSIQAAVDANPPGTAFVLKAGTHVRQTVTPKGGNSFTGEPGTVLDGQGVTQFAFKGYNGSSWVNGVTIKRLEITRYTPPVQSGAIWGGNDRAASTSGWILDSLDVHHNANLGVRIGNRMRVLRSTLRYNTTINIGGIGLGVLVDGVEVSYGNNGCPNDPGFESGGSKFVFTDSLIVRNSFFHHNCGPGLWLDIDNINAVLENNRVEDNAREGIVQEIGYKTTIRNNVVRRNGVVPDPHRPAPNWLWNAGIAVHSSSDVEVYGNLVEDNFNGIVAIQQARGTGKYGPYLVQNLFVHDNTVKQNTPQAWGLANAAAGAVQDTGDNAIFTSRNNRFQNNTYHLLPIATGNSTGFEWASGWKTVPQWQGFGHDMTGKFYR